MKKKRLIPVLLLREGWLVQSKGFRSFQNLGNPVTAVRRLSEWASDELIYLDISRENNYDLHREDLRYPNRRSIEEIIRDVASYAFMPITVGGKIRTLQDVEKRLAWGADKVAINTRVLEEPAFVKCVAKEFGSQCVVVSIDARVEGDDFRVVSHWGQIPTKYRVAEWARIAQEEGAGEILINSVDRDGMASGYDIELIQKVTNVVNIPVIACGGVGSFEHFAEGLSVTNADAIAAANIFHYRDQSVYLAKKYLHGKNFCVRPPDLMPISLEQRRE